MRRISGLMAGAALLTIVVQAGISAQQVPPVQGQSWQQRLELTDEQRAEIQQISERHREAALEAQSALVQARADLNKLMLETDPDLRDLERALNAVSQLENAQKIQSIRNRAEVMNVLPEDQQQLFNRASGFLGFRGTFGNAMMSGGRGSMGRGQTVYNRGRGSMPGRAGASRGRASMGRGQAGFSRGRGSMPGGAGSGRGGSMGMMNRGRMIPPVPPPPPPPAG